MWSTHNGILFRLEKKAILTHATLMNLRNVMLNKMSQTGKEK
jgi:hypothetical protein